MSQTSGNHSSDKLCAEHDLERIFLDTARAMECVVLSPSIRLSLGTTPPDPRYVADANA